MKILIAHVNFLLPGAPGGSRFNEFARMWTEAGHDVTVIAGSHDYATGETPPELRGRWVTETKEGDATVFRCYAPATYGKGYVGRMWVFGSLVLSGMSAVMMAKKPDVIIATSPPLTAAIPGWFASRVRGRIPLVFEIRDIWPESAITTGVIARDGALAKVLFALERFACKTADRVNVLTPAFRTDLIDRKLATGEKIVFVPNGADVSFFSPTSRDNAVRRELGWGERTVAMYAGAHGRANAIGQLVDTAEKLRERRDILIATVGDGLERKQHEEEAARRGLTNVVFYGSQPKERMPDFVNACDIGLAVLQRNPTFRTVYPNKVFDYMACERPTVLAIDGVARQLVCDEAGAGLFAEPEDASAIASALVALADDPAQRAAMGKRGRAWVISNATRDALSARYLGVLQALVRDRVS